MYVTVQEYKEWKGFTETNEDTIISDCILAAQAFIEDPDYGTGRLFECSADSTRYFDAIRDVGDGVAREDYYGEFRIVTNRWSKNRTLFLDHDLAQITTITNGDGVAVPSTEYVTEPINGSPFWRIKLKRNSSYYWTYTDSPENAISIVGRWAYSITPDAGVTQIARRLTDHLYEKRKNPSNSNNPVVTDGGYVILPSDLPPDVGKWITSKRTSLI